MDEAATLAAFLSDRYREGARAIEDQNRHSGSVWWGAAGAGRYRLADQLEDLAAKQSVVERLMWILAHAAEPAVVSTAEHALLALAQPYRDHPGFDRRWRLT